ncbi:phosphate/phosphite/phosphonate ABC transporter substrate-binding protein [Macrococcoides caseolyticum]|uniref:phosphate/phosphite/phosphonate ABC transporter substrate-binding protein n=1 Tax=Macrococcoides caseolyticum TaxID=69966 RepID=UPI001F3FA9CA|nr:phosphate/phosphite/phosphonate ABC transporter substrate-binding protein [Macrococcus caseolyticus]MCE4956009.1 phosphate/phosphite/phosphonate ABC transporter substrate-binding protein [Macrococcus caseolyticus]
MRKLIASLLVLILTVTLAACGDSSKGEKKDAKKTGSDKFIIVWYPNESGKDLKGARDAIGKVFEQATGKKVEHKLTTDYAIAIETIANGKANAAFMGAEGYIQARDKSKNVEPLVVPSGPSGTKDDALYYSWFAATPENMSQYEEGKGKYSLDKFEGKKMSFVSPSSTSGFKVPSSILVKHFAEQDKYKDLKAEDLTEGGGLFKEVLFGDSHQGSAVNLIAGRADVAAFCDTCISNYIELKSGDENKAGAIYKVKEGAEAPFTQYAGKEFGILSSTPVLNAPFVVNKETLSEDEIAKIKKELTSEKIANDKSIFLPEDSEESGLFKKTDKEKFVEVDDKWFDEIRNLGK